MMQRCSLGTVLAVAAVASVVTCAHTDGVSAAEAASEAASLIENPRQLTFEGRRAGEGYFSRDGAQFVFQSERHEGNPFYQIYLMDLETGDTRLVSPGIGKTTCAWVHPSGEKVLFASTHLDPEAEAKQQKEIEERAAATGRRYEWSFDPHYDIFEVPAEGGELVRLTDAFGYDAEGSWSPDGEHILFASNRHAYSEDLSEEEKGILERNASYFMELYIMRADGSDLRRLTDEPGYDGGPFFSHDGDKIVWRRFAADGGSAEIYTANTDGSDAKAITSLGAMSWAPFFHPSGDYVIFATSLHGFGNFELYMVDTEGKRDPVRVTDSEGFDGLPVFAPDGKRLSWASSRTPDKKAQIFMADWNDALARQMLGLDERAEIEEPEVTPPPLPQTKAAIDAGDLRRHVEVLASNEMEGRLTGTVGERLASAYVASAFEALGLEPAGDDGSYFQVFDFTAAVKAGPDNRLTIEGMETESQMDRDWRPLGLSATGESGPAEVVFAGYGIVAPAEGEQAAYDSYGELDVAGKWVMVLRYLPEDVPQERRQHLYRYAELGYKASVARSRGALGLIVASGPKAQVKDQLVPLSFEAAAGGSPLAGISISDALAEAMLGAAGRTLGELQGVLDKGESVEGFALPDLQVAAEVDLVPERRRGRNVLARLSAKEGAREPIVMVGAHLDHLGRGVPGKSLARAEEQGQVHFGADDNASGVAGLLEAAQYLADLKARGKLKPKRDIVFAAWSGEELGVLGASHFVSSLAGDEEQEDLRSEVAAYLNMDMIGRLKESLILQGVGSSSIWPREIERRNAPVGLSITISESAFLATDAIAFYLKGVPVLNAFTGVHGDYSTPRDTADKLNYEGMQKVARLMTLIGRGLATVEETPDYIRQSPKGSSPTRRLSQVYLGTIPDYTQNDGGGARLSGVAKDGPAEAAGLKGGDLVIEMAGQEIANIYDYSRALDALKIGEAVDFVVLREGERVVLSVTPGARE